MAKRWTNDEDEYLAKERAAGAPLISVALVLGRSYDSVSKRSELLRKREKSLDQLVEEIYEWQQATFADGTEEGRIAHFQEEIDEYLADPSSGEEAVDVFFLFVAIFKNRGIDLRAEAQRKLAINKARTWAKAPGGYSKHVEKEPDVFPDISWEEIPPEHRYAWLVIDPAARGFIWCTSKTMPKQTPQGHNAANVRTWYGNEGIRVRSGVDFRAIFRQRPETANE